MIPASTHGNRSFDAHFKNIMARSVIAVLRTHLHPSFSISAVPNRALHPTAPQSVVTFSSNSAAAGTAPVTRCAQNQRQHTARQSRFLLAPFPVFSAAPSGAAAELQR